MQSQVAPNRAWQCEAGETLKNILKLLGEFLLHDLLVV